VVETGLLEQDVLRLRPRLTPGVEIFAPTESPVGLVRLPREPGRWWWPFARRLLRVHEHHDEPLLCTVRRLWIPGGWFRVRDANEAPVGLLFGPRIWGAVGQLLAIRHGSALLRASYHAPDGRVLAEAGLSCSPLPFRGGGLGGRGSSDAERQPLPLTPSPKEGGGIDPTLLRGGEGRNHLELHFADCVRDEPFVKMLLLAAVLVECYLTAPTSAAGPTEAGP
jgi:hypothetical protein